MPIWVRGCQQPNLGRQDTRDFPWSPEIWNMNPNSVSIRLDMIHPEMGSGSQRLETGDWRKETGDCVMSPSDMIHLESSQCKGEWGRVAIYLIGRSHQDRTLWDQIKMPVDIVGCTLDLHSLIILTECTTGHCSNESTSVCSEILVTFGVITRKDTKNLRLLYQVIRL